MTIAWKLYREDMAPKPPRVIERAQPVCPVVLDVEVEPEPGAWVARFRHCGEPRKGKAESVDAAKQAALDAAEEMLCVALGELRLLRGLFPIAPEIVFDEAPLVVETVE